MPSCLFVNTYYRGFLAKHYSAHPELISSPSRVQQESLESECFGDSDFYSKGLQRVGWRADNIIVNADPLQDAWARENSLAAKGLQIAVAQVRRFRPDILYIQDPNAMPKEFFTAVRGSVKLIAGQIACPVGSIPFDEYDIFFTSFPHYVNRFRELRLVSYYQPLAFERRVLSSLVPFAYSDRPLPCAFIGGISAAHTKGKELLERLAHETPIEFWGYGKDTLPDDSLIRAHHHGEVWGKEMFQLFAAAKISVNRHIDVAENNANNMRLYEATGCGSLLITDYKDNLNELFEIGKEVVAYRSADECAGLISYYLANPKEAAAIAAAGQARTLRDHSYSARMERTAEILERHLRYGTERRAYLEMKPPETVYQGPTNDLAAYKEAWKSPKIATFQRALVQKELDEMYVGLPNPAYAVLAKLLAPIVRPKAPILEIGCASGYYYEVLDYLLSSELDYTGVDYSEALIHMAKSYYPRTKFQVADGSALPFPDRHFDIAISSCVIIHVPNYEEHIREAARVSNRYVVFHRTAILTDNSPTQQRKKTAYGVEMVDQYFNEAELTEQFEKHGLRVVEKRLYQPALNPSSIRATHLLERRPSP